MGSAGDYCCSRSSESERSSRLLIPLYNASLGIMHCLRTRAQAEDYHFSVYWTLRDRSDFFEYRFAYFEPGSFKGSGSS